MLYPLSVVLMCVCSPVGVQTDSPRTRTRTRTSCRNSTYCWAIPTRRPRDSHLAFPGIERSTSRTGASRGGRRVNLEDVLAWQDTTEARSARAGIRIHLVLGKDICNHGDLPLGHFALLGYAKYTEESKGTSKVQETTLKHHSEYSNRKGTGRAARTWAHTSTNT